MTDSTPRCPCCGSTHVTGKKFGLGSVTLYERYCRTCDRFEESSSADPSLTAWLERWSSAAADEDTPLADGAVQVAVDELYREVTARPWDDAPRLAYAAAIERLQPERADLIRLQVQRARDERASRDARSRPGARETALRKAHGARWAAGIEPFARPYKSSAAYRGWEFERGFVAELRTDADMVANPREYVFVNAPIEHLTLCRWSPGTA